MACNLLNFGYDASGVEAKSSKGPGHSRKLMKVFLRTTALILFLDHYVEIYWDRELRVVNFATRSDDEFFLLTMCWLSDPKEFVAMWHALR